MEDEDIKWDELLGWNESQFSDLRNAGYAYIRQGKYETALAFFEALSVLNPEEVYDLQTLGGLYLQLGKPKEAYDTLNQTLQLDSDHAATLLNMAKALFTLGKVEEGIKLAELLEDDENRQVANMAKALIIAYS
jgi:tetratricopeptide (TPR) repeat protein